MIAKISGTLAEVAKAAVLIEVGEIGYEVMVPGYALELLASKTGQQVSLYTLEYLEGSLATGGNLVPRLIGFMHSEERAFFERFTSVKGVGMRKALKALSMPISRVASAIEAKDTKLLQSMPGVGRRLADQMVAELAGKMDEFALAAAAQRGDASGWKQGHSEALEILLQLGERRSDAQELIERVRQVDPQMDKAEEIVQAVYRLKAGAPASRSGQ
ncbi:MAG: Holliday junction DNA helicase RuvA [Phycisphaerae bacterium]|nr:Holliday junction DNA helicase RuvA [Phycisphaerae bacterium]